MMTTATTGSNSPTSSIYDLTGKHKICRLGFNLIIHYWKGKCLTVFAGLLWGVSTHLMKIESGKVLAPSDLNDKDHSPVGRVFNVLRRLLISFKVKMNLVLERVASIN